MYLEKALLHSSQMCFFSSLEDDAGRSSPDVLGLCVVEVAGGAHCGSEVALLGC